MTNDNLTAEWFVFNAKSEKNIEKALNSEQFSLPYFIPKHYVIRTYHGKQQRELVPLIPHLVFVHATYHQVEEFHKQYFSDVFYVTERFEGRRKILTVPETQMNEFIELAKHYEEELLYFRPEEIHLERGVRVRVIGGPFDGVVGTLMKVKGKRSKRIVVKINDIAAIASTQIDPEYIEILK